MTPYSGLVFSLNGLKGYRYQKMCHTNVAIASTMSVYPAQSLRSISTYLIMPPDPGRGSIQNPNTLLRVKQASKTMKAFEHELISKVTPLLRNFPQHSRQFCNTVGELTWVFCVLSQLLWIARVIIDFSFIQ